MKPHGKHQPVGEGEVIQCRENIFSRPEKGLQLAAYRPFWAGFGSCLSPKIRQCC
ncbi:hypothetical protein HMPREF0290_2459 [Corynebacterium efficiens YS-314]|nr:hypothetical protein HMPREF0290_2459 [Corynebacterium efficiens YS-314]